VLEPYVLPLLFSQLHLQFPQSQFHLDAKITLVGSLTAATAAKSTAATAKGATEYLQTD
jgi:hypothetical protein